MMRTFVSGVMFAAVAGVASPATGQIVGTDFVGGDGGSPYQVACPSGQFLNGLMLRQGTLVDGLAVRCATLTPGTRTVTPGTNPNISVGTQGGVARELSCGSQGLVQGLLVTARRLDRDWLPPLHVVADAKLNCVDPSNNNAWTVETGWRMEDDHDGAYTTGVIGCRALGALSLVNGLKGGAGNYVDRIGITCGRLSAVSSAPEPPPVTAAAPAPPRMPVIRRIERKPPISTPAGPGAAASASVDTARIGRCLAYADAAEAANRQVRDYQCGLGADGGRHEASRQDHYTFCLNASEQAVADETARRQADLEACAVCRSYSASAVAQIARSKQCAGPPVGALWMPEDEDPHFHACFLNRPGEAPFVNPGVAAFEQERAAILNACGN